MAHAPSHRPRGVHQKPCRLSVSFHRPELAARLIDACLHELLRLLRPYGGLYALKPLKPWQHGPQHSLVQHLSRGGLPRGGSDACRPAASHISRCSGRRAFYTPTCNWTPATASSNCYKERSLSGGVPTSLTSANPQLRFLRHLGTQPTPKASPQPPPRLLDQALSPEQSLGRRSLPTSPSAGAR